MKMTVTLTSRGVISLPAKLRAELGLKADDRLIAEATPEGLLLRPAATLPIEIYNDARVGSSTPKSRARGGAAQTPKASLNPPPVLIFLDANILFSAAKSEGAVHELIELLKADRHELWADPFVIEEARRNLATKFPGTESRLERLLGGIRVAGTTIDPDAANLPPMVRRILPEKDRPVLAAAIRAGCEALVTGDRQHFDSLFGQTVKVSPFIPRGRWPKLFRDRPKEVRLAGAPIESTSGALERGFESLDEAGHRAVVRRGDVEARARLDDGAAHDVDLRLSTRLDVLEHQNLWCWAPVSSAIR
jgi:AbrB family looped-hinge helix DNA binding protein